KGGPEGHEVLQFGHSDPIAVRVADLRGRGNHDDLFGGQAVHDLQDALFKGGPPDDAVVYDDQVVVFLHRAIGDVVDVVTRSSLLLSWVIKVRSLASLMATFSILGLTVRILCSSSRSILGPRARICSSFFLLR